MEAPIINKVAQSNLMSIDLESYLDKNENSFFDLRECLYQGMVLREKDFRLFVKEYNWEQYTGKNVGVFCSTDAIIPSWAYMLIASRLQPYAHLITFGQEEELEKARIDDAIYRLLKEDLNNSKVVIKGCGNIQNRDYAYFQLTRHLVPVVASLMYGEPCSTVPIFKKPKP